MTPILLALLLSQTTDLQKVVVTEDVTNKQVKTGDFSNKALRVNCVTGCGAGGGTSSTFGAAFPATGTASGYSDGTNMQPARVFDGDTGGGTQYVQGAILRKSGAGGTVEAGTSTDPLRVDPTGTTTQPVSVASLPLPLGAATETTLGTRLAESTFTGRINTLGQKTMANSTPVVISSDQSALTVSGTVTANQGGAPWTVTPPAVASANNDGACVSVTASTTVLASNASRRQASVCARVSNSDTAFIKFAATATTSDFPLEPGQCYNLGGGSIYTGVIDSIANTGTQSVCVTEFN